MKIINKKTKEKKCVHTNNRRMNIKNGLQRIKLEEVEFCFLGSIIKRIVVANVM